MIKAALYFVGMFFLIILVISLTFTMIYLKIKKVKTKRKLKKHWKKYKHSKEFRKKAVKWRLRKKKLIKSYEFVKWVTIDLIRGKEYFKLFRIWAFCGYYGQGKTLGCVMHARDLQRKHPYIKIYSNIEIAGQVKKIESWEEILTLPRNSIVIYDESQSDWTSGDRDFPSDLLRKITQCRKKRLALFMTSPVYSRMNINIRESVNFVIKCKNLWSMDRWFTYTFYRAEDYEQYQENKIKLMAHRYLKQSYVVSDYDYRAYNTTEEVETLKGKKEDNQKVKAQSVRSIKKDINNEMKLMENKIYRQLRNDLLKETQIKIK